MLTPDSLTGFLGDAAVSVVTPQGHPEGVDKVAAWLDRNGVAVRSHDKYRNTHGAVYKWLLETCPMCGESDKCGTVLLHDDGRWGYKCQHDRCKGKGWQAFRQAVDPKGSEFDAIESDEGGAKPPAAAAYSPEPIEFNAFLRAEFPQAYLIPSILVEGEPLVVGAPKKSLKTLTTLDLCISLASGSPFLGHWPVTKTAAATFLTGESGKATLQRRAKAIVKSRSIRVPDNGLFLDFKLPKLSRPDNLKALEQWLVGQSIKFVAIDPAYLCLLDGRSADNAGNLYAMGNVLYPLSEMGQRHGITLCLVHHTRKRGKAQRATDEIELDDLTQSGFAEWARQWLLWSRTSGYVAGSGQHPLRLQAGGSAGHSGDWTAHIDEGDAVSGDRWDITIGEGTNAAENPGLLAFQDLILKTLAIAENGYSTESGLRSALKSGQAKVVKATGPLIEGGIVSMDKVDNQKRYSLTPKGRELSGLSAAV